MKFCPVVPEICRGQVHGPRKERKKERRKRRRRIIILIRRRRRRNGAKTISLQTLFGRLNYQRQTLRQGKTIIKCDQKYFNV
jgi:hypothetical protein